MCFNDAGYQSFICFSDSIHFDISLPVQVWLAHHQSWVEPFPRWRFGAYGENLINLGTLVTSSGWSKNDQMRESNVTWWILVHIYALIYQEIQTFHILKLYLISVCHLLGPLNYPASSHIPSCSVNPRHSHGFWGSSWRCLSCGATSGPLSSACWKMRVVHPSCLGCVPCWDEPIRSGFIVCNVLKTWWSILCVLCGIYSVFRAKPIHT